MPGMSVWPVTVQSSPNHLLTPGAPRNGRLHGRGPRHVRWRQRRPGDREGPWLAITMPRPVRVGRRTPATPSWSSSSREISSSHASSSRSEGGWSTTEEAPASARREIANAQSSGVPTTASLSSQASGIFSARRPALPRSTIAATSSAMPSGSICALAPPEVSTSANLGDDRSDSLARFVGIIVHGT